MAVDRIYIQPHFPAFFPATCSVRVVYIHQYFKTYHEGGSSRSYYLAKALVEAGNEVDMITTHNGREYTFADVEGIRVHYLPVFYDNQLGFLGRIRAFLAFMWGAYRLAARLQDVSCCYVSSTPLTVGVTALLLKHIRKIPFYFEVRDLWPLAPVQLGVIRNYLLKSLLFGLERRVYKEAVALVALSPGIEAHIRSIVPCKPIHMLPNISDCDFFAKEKKQEALARKYRVAGKFVVTYFGAVGKVNDLQSLIGMARHAQNACSRLAFMIVGTGNQLAHIQRLATEFQLANLHFVPHVSKFELRELLNVTDAVYVSFAVHPVLRTSSPNKFFDALAAGKMCITNTPGWLAELVETNECGFYADPHAPETFVNRMHYYLRVPAALEQAQHNARQLAQTRFSRILLSRKFVQLFLPQHPVSPLDEAKVTAVYE